MLDSSHENKLLGYKLFKGRVPGLGIRPDNIPGTAMRVSSLWDKACRYQTASLENFDNKTPLGYLFDSYGGLGFV